MICEKQLLLVNEVASNEDLRRETLERFARKTLLADEPHPILGTRCLLWMGGRRGKGYGSFCLRRTQVFAHRVAFALVNGAIPRDRVVMHRCDNPLCVNTEHLKLGTLRDNWEDMVNKGRGAFGLSGERHLQVKLSAAQVREIRRLHAAGMECQDIGDKFGISDVHVGRIAHGINWKKE